MSKIRRLDDLLIDKIAAGEVVERPASLIKELVENAFDAGATSIEVEIEDGGRRLIRVRDNGGGIDADDMPLTILRHATSKIANEDDLFAIGTMGFRGEALASIAAVSKFSISSQTAEVSIGSRLTTLGGANVSVQPWHGQRGTIVEVEDLFFNIPARRAFLKSTAAEFAACQEVMQAFALSRPSCGMIFTHQKKRILECLPSTSLRQRVHQVFGDTVADMLVEINRTTKYGTVSGLISPPGQSFATSKNMWFFLNQRWLKDKTLRYGVLRGYHSHLLRSRFPFAVINLDVDPTIIDVNVHPAKTEVRWQYGAEIQNLVALAVREILQQAAWAVPESMPQSFSDVSTKKTQDNLESHWIAPPKRTFVPSSSWANGPVTSQKTRSEASAFVPERRASVVDQDPVASIYADHIDINKTSTPTKTVAWSELKYVGTFARCYLMFEGRSGLLVVDQHAFHERILYEKLSKDHSILSQSQPLAIPELVHLGNTVVEQLTGLQRTPLLSAFQFSRIDDESIEVTAVPSVVAHRPLDEMLQELARSGAFSSAVIPHDVLATLACHAAVRAGEDLPENDLHLLLNAASEVDFFHNCPHGRPVFKWWSEGQVSAWFDRT